MHVPLGVAYSNNVLFVYIWGVVGLLVYNWLVIYHGATGQKRHKLMLTVVCPTELYAQLSPTSQLLRNGSLKTGQT
jgi:hypothetical protein